MSNHVQREHPVIKGGFGRLTLSSRIAGDCVWLNSIRLKLERGCTNLTSRCRPADLLCYRNLCRVSVHSLQNCWQGVLVFFCARTMNGLRAKKSSKKSRLCDLTNKNHNSNIVATFSLFDCINSSNTFLFVGAHTGSRLIAWGPEFSSCDTKSSNLTAVGWCFRAARI